MKAIPRSILLFWAFMLFGGSFLAMAAPAVADGRAEIILGNQAAQRGDLDAAIAHFSKAINTPGLSKTNLAVAYNNRGSAWDDKDQTAKALADYSKAIEIDPNYHEAYFNRSDLLERQGLLKNALADAKKAAELSPGDQNYLERVKDLEDGLTKRR
jgi:tetratricopeptide (TPR) repeat protein